MRRILRFTLILLAFLVIGLFAISGHFEDWLWFSDLGYGQLFWTPLISKGIIQIGNGTILFLLISGTLLSIRHAILTFVNERLRKRLRLVHEIDGPFYRLSQRKMTTWLVIISALVSFGVSFVTGFTGWLEVLTFLNPTPFGQGDPIFFKDLGFYVFQLPFLYTIYNTFFGPLFLLAVITALFYSFTGVIRFHSLFLWREHTIEISPAARRHLALLSMVLFMFKGLGYYFDTFRLLYSQQGLVVGAGYADIYATLPALRILMTFCAIGFIGGIVSYFRNEIRFLTLPILLVLFGGPLLSTLWPIVLQSLVVVPNELDKEIPYIQNEISLTRFGYGLDQISEEQYKGNEGLSADRLVQELPTLNNISLNDPRLMSQIYTQKQGVRQYYKFPDIDIDRYLVNGEYRQVLLAPRELSADDLASTAQTFVNFRFKYTHGYGVVASFANAVTEGLPFFAVRDVPLTTNFQEFQLTQPRIYFGELTNDWIVVNTAIKEFDYPEGNSNVESNYQGKSGIELTPINRLMLSLKHATPRFYLANEVNSQSRILLHRNILERVEKLMPFLKYDENPYLIIDKGRLRWIIDGYTVSKTFPYSRMAQTREINYIRNSVKVVVDAYDGTVDFYTVDILDPILQTYRKIFPGVFKDQSEMSAELRSHLRYPETLFTIQSNMLKNFHMMNPTEFYNKEDAWDIAQEFSSSEPKNVVPNYSVIRIPGSNHHELVLMIPFTPASSTSNSRNNMIGWLAARMDGEHYGELKLYKIPKNIEVDGPLQIESRIDQDPEISEQLALWNQKGSRVIRGHLQVLPLAGNFLYVEPIYLQADTDGSIPEMRRVVVAYEDRIVMTETLAEALAQLFGVKNLLTDLPQAITSNQDVPTISSKAANPFSQESAVLEDTQSLLKQIEQLREMLNQLENQLRSMTSSTNQTEYEQEILLEEEMTQK
ncbi:hypothetical protein Desdi_1901 [Desulfitobacterium dichloroeliminans LMG P-21439]|uniref:UPF0182 protein Desdi_1901 n=1 Tax=Desulfitobacterium dichloroeliminans (strain LMG P-21439 / DCA1) TaxID=871963 RepID=L0F8I5_DESDL|nr:UPF0182 family protein [Desulfitobacterium dichloroeliminans]AGA69350.1 hypothetical protein Desdi_1901 [Desulfitobacterium dichloroeliminans LMG P-21439]